VRQEDFPPEIRFDRPDGTLPISVTGRACALDCAHCGGHYLRHMTPLQALMRDGGPGGAASRTALAVRLEEATSLLISGGCDSQGRVPVEPYLATIGDLRQGRRVNWHLGLSDGRCLDSLLASTDVVSFDFVGDDETIRDVYGLDRGVAAYVSCYGQLRRRFPVVPHVTIGLRGGDLGHERQALALLRDLGADALVFLVFVPTPGSRYAGRRPPDLAAVAELMAEARVSFPQTPLTLGCMRPGGLYRRRLDTLAVRLGLNGIVNPAGEAIELAERLGLRVTGGRECCAF
jgi:lipoyl synthase